MASVVLTHAPASAAQVRHRLADELRGCGMPAEIVDDAELVLAELVGNAVRHARPLPDGSMIVRWWFEDHALRLSVTDGGAPTSPSPRDASTGEIGGRGLTIVAALAAAWGVDRQGDGTAVWAELRIPDAPLPAPTRGPGK